MRLLTHNQLVCIVKGCAGHYPLQLAAKKVTREESDINPEFISSLMSKIDYAVLLQAAGRLGIMELPAELPANLHNVEAHGDLLQTLHSVLLDTHVEEGDLKCGKCGRVYPIQLGIPNMRLTEFEV